MNSRRPFGPIIGALALVAALAFPLTALAATYIHDGAQMLSTDAATRLDARLGAFADQTHKSVVVVTVPSLNGSTLDAAAQQAFSQYNVNGVLIFVALNDRKDAIVPDSASAHAAWFSPSILAPIRRSMESQFKAEDYSGGITNAAETILSIYRSHLGSLDAPVRNGAPVSYGNAGTANYAPHRRGPSTFFWLVLLGIGFFVFRSVMRASTQRPPYGPMGGPPAAGPMGGPPAPGPTGAPMGYGGGMGGGGFMSGLLGGLGGAWLGNQLFGGGMGGGMGGMGGGSNIADASQMGSPDAGGWTGDAGQADMSGGSSGDFGGGGFGDMGGGGFGDMGGGGDSGGW